MAEKEHHPQRKIAPSNRGRPAYHNRIYQHLGVRDLREIIDRKRSERGHVSEVSLPPDPSYSYLQDPLRENPENVHEASKQMNTRRTKNYSNSNLKRDKERQGGHTSNYPNNKDIENPLNIKVEFSTSTGEHVYKLDENTVLPTIKHVPDLLSHQNRPYRGRGRGRGRGVRQYQTRTVRNKTGYMRNEQPSNEVAPPHVSVTCEENWDDEVNEPKEVSEHGEECEQDEAQDVNYYEEDVTLPRENEGQSRIGEDNLEKQVERLSLNEDKNVPQESTKKDDTSVSVGNT